MSNQDYYKALSEANEILLENYQLKMKQEIQNTIKRLYIGQDSSFRRFMQK